MTSGRFPLSLGLVALLTAVTMNILGCNSGAGGCTQCPEVAGHYTLTLGDGSDSADCNSVPPRLPQGPLDVSQEGSTLSADLNGMTLRGTLYQTYDFTLLGLNDDPDGGSGQADTASLSGRYIPVVTDGGVPTLTGEYQADYSRTSPAGTVRCSVTRSFTATRQ